MTIDLPSDVARRARALTGLIHSAMTEDEALLRLAVAREVDSLGGNAASIFLLGAVLALGAEKGGYESGLVRVLKIAFEISATVSASMEKVDPDTTIH